MTKGEKHEARELLKKCRDIKRFVESSGMKMARGLKLR
jgi:hypothetical protein